MNEEISPPRPVSGSEDLSSTDREVSDLRREVVESRNLVIKADNLLKNMHAELKRLGGKQDEFARHQFWSTWWVYGLFALLALGSAFAISRASTAHERELQKASEDQAQRAITERNKLASDDEARRQESQHAAVIYEQLGSEKEGPGLNQAITNALNIKKNLLSALEVRAMEDRVASLKAQVAQASLERGSRAFRRNDWQEAATELGRYADLSPGSVEPLTWFHLGNARLQLKDYAGAIRPLEAFLKASGGTKTAQYAGLLLGDALVATANTAKAREAYDRALSLYPGSEFAPQIRQRLRHLSAVEAVAGQAGPPAQPAAPRPPAGGGVTATPPAPAPR